VNYEYPLRESVAVNQTVAGYGSLKPDTLPLSQIASHKKLAADLVDKVGFDQ
jgi:iron(III) transport system substrate-binding protein